MSRGPSVRVRAFSKPDLQEVLEIERGSFPYPYSPDVFHEFLEQKAVFLVAEHVGKIVGYVAADAVPGGRGLVISVAVDPKYRRRGIGSLLMCEALTRLRGKCSKVMLHVATKNSSGQAFYIRFGFKPMGMIRRYYPDGDDAIVLENTLGDVLDRVCSQIGGHLS